MFIEFYFSSNSRTAYNSTFQEWLNFFSWRKISDISWKFITSSQFKATLKLRAPRANFSSSSFSYFFNEVATSHIRLSCSGNIWNLHLVGKRRNLTFDPIWLYDMRLQIFYISFYIRIDRKKFEILTLSSYWHLIK